MTRFFIALRKSLAIATTSAFILPLALTQAHAGAEDAWKCPDSNSMCWTETFPKKTPSASHKRQTKEQKRSIQRDIRRGKLSDHYGKRTQNHKGHGRSVPVWQIEPERDSRSHQKRRNKNGEWVAAGAIGLALGAIIANELSQKQPVYAPQLSQPHYGNQPQASNTFPPAPRAVSNRQDNSVITLESAFQPWSQGWYEWCDDRYRSFNANTGTYRGYDGLDHFCVVK